MKATVDTFETLGVIPEVATSFTVEEMQRVHRFCEEFTPLRDTDLAASGTDLARQLRDMIREHFKDSMRRGLEERGVNPDAPRDRQ